jgi:hypothetical protein
VAFRGPPRVPTAPKAAYAGALGSD